MHAIFVKTGAKEVFDFGAGRGARWLTNARATSAIPATCAQLARRLSHSTSSPSFFTYSVSDGQVVLQAAIRLPFPDSSFNVIMSDVTCVNIEDAPFGTIELFKVLRPGGWMCVRTQIPFGYVRLFSKVVPKLFHDGALLWSSLTERRRISFRTTIARTVSDRSGNSSKLAPCIHSTTAPSQPTVSGNGLLENVFLLLMCLLPRVLATASGFSNQIPKTRLPIQV